MCGHLRFSSEFIFFALCSIFKSLHYWFKLAASIQRIVTIMHLQIFSPSWWLDLLIVFVVSPKCGVACVSNQNSAAFL